MTITSPRLIAIHCSLSLQEFYESVHSLIHILCGVPKVFEHTVVTMAGHVTSCAQSVLNALESMWCVQLGL